MPCATRPSRSWASQDSPTVRPQANRQSLKDRHDHRDLRRLQGRGFGRSSTQDGLRSGLASRHLPSDGLWSGPQVPDSEGKLTDLEKDRVIAWLSNRWNTPNCPFHGPTNWDLGDAVGTHPFAGTGGGAPGSGVQFGGSTYPLVVLTCATCGYVVFINAITVGIVTMGAAPIPSTEPDQEPSHTPEAD